jgi:hypothetical protein
MTSGIQTDRPRRFRLSAWDRHTIVSFAEDVLAQAAGTVIAAGLVYAGAAALGMIQHARPRTVLLVLLLSIAPMLAALLLRRWVGHHARGNMRQDVLRDLGQRMAAGAPVSADDLQLMSLLACGKPTSRSGS